MADMADQAAPFQQLDFLYTPSRDVATDLVGTEAAMGCQAALMISTPGWS
jgi:hypothetical protein